MIGIQANGPARDVTALTNSDTPAADPLDDWVATMIRLQKTHRVPILAGCCGTDPLHQQRLAEIGASWV